MHAFASEPHLVEKGLTNYWGYSTLGFFAPHAAFATAAAQAAGPAAVLDELRGAVHALHEAGLEVLLDVVYNHTCEGGLPGQHLSWRGLDNATYYAHDGGAPGRARGRHGHGQHARLPPGRGGPDDARLAALLGGRRRRRRLPVRPGGDARPRPGRLLARPPRARRDGDRAQRCTASSSSPSRGTSAPAAGAPGSSRCRSPSGTTASATPRARSGWPTPAAPRTACPATASATWPPACRAPWTCSGTATRRWSAGPVASVNYVTAHDGFTLADLVAYDHKHNAANGEQNRDGSDDNRSWNHGIEGHVGPDSPAVDIVPAAPPLDPQPVRHPGARRRHADDHGRRRDGPHAAGQQQRVLPGQRDLLGALGPDAVAHGPARDRPLAARCCAASTPRCARSGSTRAGRYVPGRRPDLAWFDALGVPFDHDRWHDPSVRTLQMVRTAPPPEKDTVLLVINGSLDAVHLVLADDHGGRWRLAWDSVWENPSEERAAAIEGSLHAEPGEATVVEALSMRVYVLD